MASGISRGQNLQFYHLFRNLQAQNCLGENFTANFAERCCFWYVVVLGNNSEYMLTPGQNAYLSCEVFVPHDTNNKFIERVIKVA